MKGTKADVKPGRRRRGLSLAWVQGLLCGALVALLPAVAVLLGALLAPALLALWLDDQAGRPRARAIGLCNLSACVPPMRALWSAGHSVNASLMLIASPRVIGTAWGAGAVGWLLVELAPIGMRALVEALSAARAARLRTRRAALLDQWSLTEDG